MEQQLNAQFRYNTITMRPLMGARTVSEAIEQFGKIIGIKLVPESEAETTIEKIKSEAEYWKQQYELWHHDFEVLHKAEEGLAAKYRTLANIVKPIKDIEL